MDMRERLTIVIPLVSVNEGFFLVSLKQKRICHKCPVKVTFVFEESNRGVKVWLLPNGSLWEGLGAVRESYKSRTTWIKIKANTTDDTINSSHGSLSFSEFWVESQSGRGSNLWRQ